MLLQENLKSALRRQFSCAITRVPQENLKFRALRMQFSCILRALQGTRKGFIPERLYSDKKSFLRLNLSQPKFILQFSNILQCKNP